MSKTILKGKNLSITHTVEEGGSHITLLSDHYADTMVITAVLRGNGRLFIEGQEYSISDGDIFSIGLNEIHSFHFDDGGYHERISIYFHSSILSPFWEYKLPLMQLFTGHPPGLGNHYSSAEYDREEVGSVLKGICSLTDAAGESISPMEEGKAHLLVLRLLFSLYGSFETNHFSAPEVSEVNSSVADICRYIRENPRERHSYESIQNRFFVSRYFLSAVFKRNTGFTLNEYILHTRMMRVSALVREGQPIAKAAEAAGFRNYSNFYKDFKKHKKVSPQKYYGERKC